jgi:hypothetical protein
MSEEEIYSAISREMKMKPKYSIKWREAISMTLWNALTIWLFQKMWNYYSEADKL